VQTHCSRIRLADVEVLQQDFPDMLVA